MTDPMPYRCPAIEPGMGLLERCILNVGHGGGFHMAAGAWPVEGSTPRQDAEQVATPPRCVHQIYTGSGWCVRCQLKVGHEAPHTNGMMSWLHNDPRRIEDAPGSTPLDSPPPDMRSRRQGGRGAAAGEVVSVPPPGEIRLIDYGPHPYGLGTIESVTPVGEPAAVPPPVDALLRAAEENTSVVKALIDLVNDYGVQSHAFGLGDAGASDTMTEVWREINDKIRTLWAAGVEEGRRQGVRRIAQGTDEWATYIRERAYELGVAEGRRQATEERTEEAVRIDVSLDSPAYRRQLQKMIRTGQIVLPDADHG